MDPDFGGRHHHFYFHDHRGFAGPHEVFEWLPLLVGVLVTVAVAWVLLGGGRFEPTSRAVGLQRIPDPVRKRWQRAVCSHAATAREFAAYECDPAAVGRHPDLADVTRPATTLFIDAFAEANTLVTEEYPGVEHAERFIQAAQRAQRTWRDAVDTAQRNTPARFAPDERVLVKQPLAPLAVADHNSPESEGRHAHQRARHRLVHIEGHPDPIPIPRGRHHAQAPAPRHALSGRPLSSQPTVTSIDTGTAR